MSRNLFGRIKRRRAIVLDAFERALDGLESWEEGVTILPYVERQLRIALESVEMARIAVQEQGKVALS